MTDSIRLLHIPHEPTLNDTDPPPPPGYVRKTFDGRGGTKLFRMLLACSTQLHGMGKEEGKNLASMSTEITLLDDEKLNKRLAKKNNILVTTVGHKSLLQTYAIIDSGADTNCSNKTLRKCLGMDRLPDAPTGLQGATGKGEDILKNRMRLVTMDNEITAMEARCIYGLGYNGPNSDIFWNCVKTELSIDKETEGQFNFAQEGSTPRVLVGLKNGGLLAKDVDEKELMSLGMKKPWLSPSLQVWRTAVNSKLLITGSLGVDPLLVEEKSNYPRIKILVEHGRKEEELIHNLKQEINQFKKILNRKFKLPEDENPRVLEVQESAESIEEKISGEHVDKTLSPRPTDT